MRQDQDEADVIAERRRQLLRDARWIAAWFGLWWLSLLCTGAAMGTVLTASLEWARGQTGGGILFGVIALACAGSACLAGHLAFRVHDRGPR